MLSPLEPKVAELMSKCLQGQMESAQQYLSKSEQASAADQLSGHTCYQCHPRNKTVPRYCGVFIHVKPF